MARSNWPYAEDGSLRDDVYTKVQLVGFYEHKNDIPYIESLTTYFSDMDVFELRDGTTESALNAAYEKYSKLL
jgi:hypothetical protein